MPTGDLRRFTVVGVLEEQILSRTHLGVMLNPPTPSPAPVGNQ